LCEIDEHLGRKDSAASKERSSSTCRCIALLLDVFEQGQKVPDKFPIDLRRSARNPNAHQCSEGDRNRQREDHPRGRSILAVGESRLVRNTFSGSTLASTNRRSTSNNPERLARSGNMEM
jgi:hypothetical protein